MTMTTREAFEKGTHTFNARDIDAFVEVLARFASTSGEDARVLELGLDPYNEQFGRARAAHVARHATGSLLEKGR